MAEEKGKGGMTDEMRGKWWRRRKKRKRRRRWKMMTEGEISNGNRECWQW